MNVYRILFRYFDGTLDTVEAVAETADGALELASRMCPLFYPIQVERVA